MPGPVARPGARPRVGDAVLDRAFALLGAFDTEHRALRLADLAHRTGLPRSTALRLARKLTASGALERQDDGRYVIGLRLLELASLAPRGHGLRTVAMPFLEDLFQVTEQHVVLAVREEDEALLVERLSGHNESRAHYRVGGRMPLASTGVGLVLLAHAPVDVQERALASFAPGQEVEGIRTSADLRRVLAEVRRGGYALGRRAEPPHTSVAAPVRDAHGVVAAVSVVAPSDEFAAACVPAVRATARAVSREMTRTTPPAAGERLTR